MKCILTSEMGELLQLFLAAKVRFLVVGGFAVNFHGYPRLTQDLDLLIIPNRKNGNRAMAAIEIFGFKNVGLPSDFFSKPGGVLHIGNPPNRIDFLTVIKGVSLGGVWKRAVTAQIDGFTLKIISRSDLIRSKKASGRTKDLADAEELIALSPR